ESGDHDPPPRRLDTPERTDDPETLGGVVEGEADDQHRRKADLPGARRDAYREALGEVVEPDRGGDRHPGPQRPRPGARRRLLLEGTSLLDRQLGRATADRRG